MMIKVDNRTFDDFLAGVPNVPQAEVPDGRDENDNVELRRWQPEGKPPRSSEGARDHVGHDFFVSVPEMRSAVGVVNGGGEVEPFAHLRAHFGSSGNKRHYRRNNEQKRPFSNRHRGHVSFRRRCMSPFLAELVGTLVLVLLGDGIVANAVLKQTKGHNPGWISITAGWAFAVTVAVYCVNSS